MITKNLFLCFSHRHTRRYDAAIHLLSDEVFLYGSNLGIVSDSLTFEQNGINKFLPLYFMSFVTI